MPGMSDIKAGEAYMEITARMSKFKKGLSSATKRLRAWGKSAGAAMRKWGKRIGIAAGTAGAAMAAATKKFMDSGDEIAKAARRMGVSAEKVGALSHVAEIGGANMEALEKGFKRLQRAVEDSNDGLATYQRQFKKLNLSWEELGKMTPEEQFITVTDAMAELESHSKKAAIAQQLFGRAGTQLIPMINATDKSMRKQIATAQTLLGVTDKQYGLAERATDAWTRVKLALKGLTMQIGSQLAPWVIELSKRVVTYVKEAGGMKNVVDDLVDKIKPFIQQMRTLGRVIGKIAMPVIRQFKEALAELDAQLGGATRANIENAQATGRITEKVSKLLGKQRELVRRYAELRGEQNRTAAQEKEMKGIADELTRAGFDVAGAFEKAAGSVKKMVDQFKELAKKAMTRSLENDIAALESNIGDLNKKLLEAGKADTRRYMDAIQKAYKRLHKLREQKKGLEEGAEVDLPEPKEPGKEPADKSSFAAMAGKLKEVPEIIGNIVPEATKKARAKIRKEIAAAETKRLTKKREDLRATALEQTGAFQRAGQLYQRVGQFGTEARLGGGRATGRMVKSPEVKELKDVNTKLASIRDNLDKLNRAGLT